MTYSVKPYEVPRRPSPAALVRKERDRREISATPPRSLPAFTVEAPNDAKARTLIRERYKQQGRTIRALNALNDFQFVIYVETK